MSFPGDASALAIPHVFPDGTRESGVFADVRPVEEVGDLSGYAGGKSKLGFSERALLLALRVPEGDFRDWAEIAAWATMIAGAIGGEGSSDVR